MRKPQKLNFLLMLKKSNNLQKFQKSFFYYPNFFLII